MGPTSVACGGFQGIRTLERQKGDEMAETPKILNERLAVSVSFSTGYSLLVTIFVWLLLINSTNFILTTLIHALAKGMSPTRTH